MLKLENFYGIEIDDFAHEIAILSLWLAKHQMNVEFEELFGAEIPLIPLRDAGNVVCGNAARLEWEEVCDPASGETYLLGNPPYHGVDAERRAEGGLRDYFGTTRYPKNLDYISLWFFKGARLRRSPDARRLAFVSTNSICQGDHVGLMWPHDFRRGRRDLVRPPVFPWSNQAKGKAGVTCVIVGLVPRRPSANVLYSDRASDGRQDQPVPGRRDRGRSCIAERARLDRSAADGVGKHAE